MRLLRLEASGFRAFASPVDIDIRGDVIVVHGDNGSGKTSLFDAVLWCLAGEIPRFNRSPRAVTSLFGSGGDTFVRLTMGSTEPEMIVTRSVRGDTSSVVVETPGSSHSSGPAADAQLLSKIWPAALESRTPLSTLALVLARSVYLQQDAVRDFVVTDREEQRFDILSELVGAGRISELEKVLTSSRHSWSLATTEQKDNLDSLRTQVSRLRTDLDRLSDESIDEIALLRDVSLWLHDVGVEDGASSVGTARQLDGALLRLRAELARQTAKSSIAEGLNRHLQEAPNLSRDERTELAEGRKQLRELQQSAVTAQRVLADAQSQAAAQRAAALVLEEEHSELQAFASMALRHLADVCPVCQQKYDVRRTKERLESIVGSSAPIVESVEGIAVLAERSAQLDAAILQLQVRVRELEAKQAAMEQWRTSLMDQLIRMEVYQVPDNLEQFISEAVLSSARDAVRLRTLVEKGDRLVLNLARAAESGTRKALTTQLSARIAELSALESWHRRRTETYDAASRMISEIREASFDAVALQLESMEPVVTRIFVRMGSHPLLTRVLLKAVRASARGRVSISIGDANEIVTDPLPVLSSSQLNVLAVALFAATNLSAVVLPLDCMLLDDPVQGLDDINVLGLIDTLRRLRGQRQIVISTHDRRIAGLLRRKLRPTSSDERTLLVELGEWGRRGVVVRTTDVPGGKETVEVAA